MEKKEIQIADNAIFKTVKNRNVCISRKQKLVLAQSIYIRTARHYSQYLSLVVYLIPSWSAETAYKMASSRKQARRSFNLYPEN